MNLTVIILFTVFFQGACQQRLENHLTAVPNEKFVESNFDPVLLKRENFEAFRVVARFSDPVDVAKARKGQRFSTVRTFKWWNRPPEDR